MEAAKQKLVSNDDISIRIRINHATAWEDRLIQLLVLEKDQARRVFTSLAPEIQAAIQNLLLTLTNKRPPVVWLEEKFKDEPDKLEQIKSKISLFHSEQILVPQN